MRDGCRSAMASSTLSGRRPSGRTSTTSRRCSARCIGCSRTAAGWRSSRSSAALRDAICSTPCLGQWARRELPRRFGRAAPARRVGWLCRPGMARRSTADRPHRQDRQLRSPRHDDRNPGRHALAPDARLPGANGSPGAQRRATAHSHDHGRLLQDLSQQAGAATIAKPHSQGCFAPECRRLPRLQVAPAPDELRVQANRAGAVLSRSHWFSKRLPARAGSGSTSDAPAVRASGYSELQAGGGGHHRRAPGVDGGDDLLGVDDLQVDAGRAEVGVAELSPGGCGRPAQFAVPMGERGQRSVSRASGARRTSGGPSKRPGEWPGGCNSPRPLARRRSSGECGCQRRVSRRLRV